MIRRACLEPACAGTAAPGARRCAAHAVAAAGVARARERARERDPIRRELYGPSWRAHSRARRAAEPWCARCGTPADLTVDHPTDAVLCRPCHATLENARRRRGRGS